MDKIIGIIGGGNMGRALISGLMKRGHSKNKLWLSDHNTNKLDKLHSDWGIHITLDNLFLSQQVDILILAVKPQDMKSLVLGLSGIEHRCSLLVSIAAGITCSQLYGWLGTRNYPVIRAMPNSPALLGYGVTGLYADSTTDRTLCREAEQLLCTVGETVWISDEFLMDSVTALSGSGPAYFFYVMECLIHGGEALGLSKAVAQKLVFHTALGAAQMALQTSSSLEMLRENVTSPGGTTEQALAIFEGGKLSDLFRQALKAAMLRGKELNQAF